MILRQGMTVTLIGVATGLAGALGASRLLGAFLFDVSATDMPTLSASAATLTFAALAACYLPARRATRVDPMRALRSR